MYLRLLMAAAFSLVTSSAVAATVAQSSGAFTLQAVGGLPEGVVITVLDTTLTSADRADGPLARAAARADGYASPDPDGIDFGEVEAIASADTTGSGLTGSALAEAFAGIELFVENTSQVERTVIGLLTYDLLTSVTLDDAGVDTASASLLFDFIIGGASIFSQALLSDAATPGEASAQGAFEIPLTLPAGIGAPVSLTLDARTSADDVSPVPLPASGLLFVAAIGGLAVLRRRTHVPPRHP